MRPFSIGTTLPRARVDVGGKYKNRSAWLAHAAVRPIRAEIPNRSNEKGAGIEAKGACGPPGRSHVYFLARKLYPVVVRLRPRTLTVSAMPVDRASPPRIPARGLSQRSR